MIQPMIASILVPLDGSPFGEHALINAIAVARSSAAAVNLIHVEEEPERAGTVVDATCRTRSKCRRLEPGRCSDVAQDPFSYGPHYVLL